MSRSVKGGAAVVCRSCQTLGPARAPLSCTERNSMAMSARSFSMLERNQVERTQSKALIAVCAFGQSSARSDDPNTISVGGGASGAAASKRWSVPGRRRSRGVEFGAPAVTMVPSPRFWFGCRCTGSSAADAPGPNPSIKADTQRRT